MVVSEEKTKFQILSLTKKPVEIELRYNGKKLEKTKEANFIGVTFDNKLTWNMHIAKMSEKSSKRLRLLQRLAGTKGGSSRSTLNTTYNMYVKPCLTYCSEALITTNKTNKSIIEKILNEALRLVTGVVKSTPIQAMYAFTRTKPLFNTIEQQALIQHEKMVRCPNVSTWEKYKTEKPKLKTQSGFMQEIKNVKTKVTIPEKKEKLKVTVNPINSLEIADNLDLKEPITNEMLLLKLLKLLAPETITNRYPSVSWWHIYTDSSLQSTEERARAGVCCESFSLYKKLGKFTTNFDGEITAIKLALEHLIYRTTQFKKAFI